MATTGRYTADLVALEEDWRNIARKIHEDPNRTNGTWPKDLIAAIDELVGAAYAQGVRGEPLEDLFDFVLTKSDKP